MSAVTVVGGVYVERCIWPDWDMVFGSGGRGAAAIGGLVDNVRLLSYATEEVAAAFFPYASLYGVEFIPVKSPTRVGFDYVHPVSVPAIRPAFGTIPQNRPIEVRDDVVVRYGMLEGTAVVDADICVYDPQAAFNPEDFHANGSKANRLAIVANANEMRALTGCEDVTVAAQCLLDGWGAEVVVAKCGLLGALLLSGGTVTRIPAYKAASSFTIGSGDVFTSTFAAFWACQGLDPIASARLASMAVAEYVEDRNLPARPAAILASSVRETIEPRSGRVYLAGPFFTMGQRWLIDEARRALTEAGLQVFSPFHEIGPGPAAVVGPADLAALEDCDIVFAVLDGLDAGTVFEIGYARALGKQVIGFNQTVAQEDLKMVEGSGCVVIGDFATAVMTAATR